MKPHKAIELNKQVVYSLRQGKKIDHADAAQLGIEALKVIEKARSKGYSFASILLPGEDS